MRPWKHLDETSPKPLAFVVHAILVLKKIGAESMDQGGVCIILRYALHGMRCPSHDTPHAIPWDMPMPFHVIPFHSIPCHPVPFCAMPMRCPPMPCHAIPCHAMPCHAIPFRSPRHAIAGLFLGNSELLCPTQNLALTLSEPQSRFGQKLLGVRVHLSLKRDCGSVRVSKRMRTENPISDTMAYILRSR